MIVYIVTANIKGDRVTLLESAHRTWQGAESAAKALQAELDSSGDTEWEVKVDSQAGIPLRA